MNRSESRDTERLAVLCEVGDRLRALLKEIRSTDPDTWGGNSRFSGVHRGLILAIDEIKTMKREVR